jgi:SAM-dependent methyltransferase
MDNLQEEAIAFDSQIEERIANGHIPDLRRAPKCDYFYANSWRHPAYVKLDFGHLFARINQAIVEHSSTDGGQSLRVLEIGCGPGYLSLELARSGHSVTGIDLSPKCIEVARRFAEEDPWKHERGPLNYIADDFLGGESLSSESFDAVVFLGALHHFPDQDPVGQRVTELLAPNGIVVAHEPTRDRITESMVELGLLIRVILSAGNGYFEKIPVPTTDKQLEKELDKIKMQLELVSETGSHAQSPNDNEAGYAEMANMLRKFFTTISEEDTFSFFHEIIGGLRFDEQTNISLARFLRDMDSRLVKSGLLPAYEFLYIGRRSK